MTKKIAYTSLGRTFRCELSIVSNAATSHGLSLMSVLSTLFKIEIQVLGIDDLAYLTLQCYKCLGFWDNSLCFTEISQHLTPKLCGVALHESSWSAYH